MEHFQGAVKETVQKKHAVQDRIAQEQDKVLHIAHAHAVVDPRTMVVHQQNAAIARTKDDSRRKGTPAMMALRRFVRIADSTAIQQLARFLRHLLQRLRIMRDGSGVGKAAFKESMAT